MLAPNVRVIEPKKRVENTMDILRAELPKRVCAYCRVSTDSEEQKTIYPREAFTAENAAKIPCRQALGTYKVIFER